MLRDKKIETTHRASRFLPNQLLPGDQSTCEQVRIKGGGNGGNCPGPPAARDPRGEIYLFQIK